MASDLSTLIASLREAREGRRTLDFQIERSLRGEPIEIKTWWYVNNHVLFEDGAEWHDADLLPPVTTDLTAAVALAQRVFPGWVIRMTIADEASAMLDNRNPNYEHVRGHAPTPALALCLAVLIAKEKAP